MNTLTEAVRLSRAGLFGESLVALSGPIPQEQKHTARILEAELLDYVGQHAKSGAIAASLLQSRQLSDRDVAACERVLGRLCLEDGSTDSALQHFQRAVSLASGTESDEVLCWAQIGLFLVVGDRSGPEASQPLIAAARTSALALGESRMAAAVHVFVAEMEGKRGFLKSAERHARIALQLLSGMPNAWLQAVAENVLLACCLLQSRFDTAHRHGIEAIRLAQQASAASTLRACLGNMGNLYRATGDFSEAARYFESAALVLPSRGEKNNATLDSLAGTKLLLGQLDQCSALLARIDDSIQRDEDRLSYSHRHAALTKLKLFEREGRLPLAERNADWLIESSRRMGDRLLLGRAWLAKAELELQRNNIDLRTLGCCLDNAAPLLTSEAPELYAQYEKVLACSLRRTGQPEASLIHLGRARRICAAIGSVPCAMEVDHAWELANKAPSSALPLGSYRMARASAGARSMLHSIAALVLFPTHPEFIAREIVELLMTSQCVHWAVAVTYQDSGEAQILTQMGTIPQEGDSRDVKEFIVGSSEGRKVMIRAEASSGVDAKATVSAVDDLLSALRELERARTEFEVRETLWPVEDGHLPSCGAVASGHLREVLFLARRLANTGVTVLITGESGTGKEVVARALHQFSDRSHHSLVPFNCSAVPRELAEAHLFGHRRGAFTGADRDSLGVIRTAKGGTLFLDEVGELSLDIQPKLLRFLESGEVCPLGESSPVQVDVRVVAATNRDLEALVRDGRFREDLFYRLRVVPLAIRPLRERRDEIPSLVHHFMARAAQESKRGSIRITDAAMERLLLYSWPGNIRQLQNEIRRMVALADNDGILEEANVSAEILGTVSPQGDRPNGRAFDSPRPLGRKLIPTIAQLEREMIQQALTESGGRLEVAAKNLGISRKGLYLKRQRLGL